jgi:putative transposase
MNFYPYQLFHVYNQGNNRQTIFFKDEHYQFFTWKMKAYLLPFADIISYCLMPTHYHWQIYVKCIEVDKKLFRSHVGFIEKERRFNTYGPTTNLVLPSNLPIIKNNDTMRLNESIGVLQMSYTKAINKEKNWKGSLFRKDCKAKDGWIDEFITLIKTGGKIDSRFTAGSDYAFACFEYINNNPKEAGLVDNILDWPFSSAREYAGLANDSICNLNLGREIFGFK